jgi:hypothetical protein
MSAAPRLKAFNVNACTTACHPNVGRSATSIRTAVAVTALLHSAGDGRRSGSAVFG